MFSVSRLGLQKFSALNSMSVRHGGTIRVILLQDLPNRGSAGELVNVKRGYARNFLIPKKIAAYGTPANKTKYSDIIKSASPVPETISELTIRNIKFERASTLSGGLFGSVSASDIIAFYAEKNYVAKSVVIENDVIKSLGSFVVKVDGVKVNVEVAPLPQA